MCVLEDKILFATVKVNNVFWKKKIENIVVFFFSFSEILIIVVVKLYLNMFCLILRKLK